MGRQRWWLLELLYGRGFLRDFTSFIATVGPPPGQRFSVLIGATLDHDNLQALTHLYNPPKNSVLRVGVATVGKEFWGIVPVTDVYHDPHP